MAEKKILIVDDENYIRLLLRRTLEDFEYEGVQVLAAEDGVEGLEAIRAHRPDLVFLDLMMPRMSGDEVCRHVREDKGLSGVHVIVLTAKGQLPDFEEGLGPDECMTKPFDPDQIVLRASQVLDIDLGYDL